MKFDGLDDENCVRDEGGYFSNIFKSLPMVNTRMMKTIADLSKVILSSAITRYASWTPAGRD